MVDVADGADVAVWLLRSNFAFCHFTFRPPVCCWEC